MTCDLKTYLVSKIRSGRGGSGRFPFAYQLRSCCPPASKHKYTAAAPYHQPSIDDASGIRTPEGDAADDEEVDVYVLLLVDDVLCMWELDLVLFRCETVLCAEQLEELIIALRRKFDRLHHPCVWWWNRWAARHSIF